MTREHVLEVLREAFPGRHIDVRPYDEDRFPNKKFCVNVDKAGAVLHLLTVPPEHHEDALRDCVQVLRLELERGQER